MEKNAINLKFTMMWTQYLGVYFEVGNCLLEY